MESRNSHPEYPLDDLIQSGLWPKRNVCFQWLNATQTFHNHLFDSNPAYVRPQEFLPVQSNLREEFLVENFGLHTMHEGWRNPGSLEGKYIAGTAQAKYA